MPCIDEKEKKKGKILDEGYRDFCANKKQINKITNYIQKGEYRMCVCKN